MALAEALEVVLAAVPLAEAHIAVPTEVPMEVFTVVVPIVWAHMVVARTVAHTAAGVADKICCHTTASTISSFTRSQSRSFAEA